MADIQRLKIARRYSTITIIRVIIIGEDENCHRHRRIGDVLAQKRGHRHRVFDIAFDLLEYHAAAQGASLSGKFRVTGREGCIARR